jgi:hypothetical protein
LGDFTDKNVTMFDVTEHRLDETHDSPEGPSKSAASESRSALAMAGKQYGAP